MRAVFLEYAWDMGWCDPCAAAPLSPAELAELGVFWLGAPAARSRGRIAPPPQDVFVTRLHLRYDRDHFPQDLQFQQTGDRSNFQGRYVLRHPWTGDATCPAAATYRRELAERREAQAARLAALTGRDLAAVRRRMGLSGTCRPPSRGGTGCGRGDDMEDRRPAHMSVR